MTWVLYLYDESGDTIGWANHLEGSYSTDVNHEKGDALFEALSARPEFDGTVGPSGTYESEDGLAYPVWDTVVADIELSKPALERVGSDLVAVGLVDSYELIDE